MSSSSRILYRNVLYNFLIYGSNCCGEVYYEKCVENAGYYKVMVCGRDFSANKLCIYIYQKDE
jgi:hypothetical protein